MRRPVAGTGPRLSGSLRPLQDRLIFVATSWSILRQPEQFPDCPAVHEVGLEQRRELERGQCRGDRLPGHAQQQKGISATVI